ncbi:M56 family metallopeptidase [Angustibacter speluncae]
MPTPLVLGLLAVLLAGPAPALLRRWTATRRTPRSAMLLWQAVALAAVLAALGAGLSLVTQVAWRQEPTPVRLVVAGAALVVTAVVLGRLLLTGHLVGTRLRELRQRHREQVDLLAEREQDVSVLTHDVPVAYCLPGARSGRVVLTRGVLATLSPEATQAVLVHERAHLAARHDLVVEAFTVLHQAFPRYVRSAAALTEVRLLVELLADAAAVRAVGARPLAQALLALAGGRVPDGTLGATAGDLPVRADLLVQARPRPVQTVVLAVLALAVLALPTTLVVLPWLSSLD